LRVGDGGRAFDRGYTGRRARPYPTRWGCGFAVEFDQPCIKPQLRRTEANTFLEELDWLLLRKAIEEPDEGDLVGKAKPIIRAAAPAELHKIFLGQGGGPLERETLPV